MLISLLLTAALRATSVSPDPCTGSSTPDVNACLSKSLDRSNKRMEDFLQAALKRYGGESEAAVRLGIQAAQDSFLAYRSIECATVFENWKDGTIRGAMDLSCQTALTDSRTHDIWDHWLRYMDDTPQIRPEPKQTK